MHRLRIRWLPGIICVFIFCGGCTSLDQVGDLNKPDPVALRFFDWEDDIPESVFHAFEDETGIKVEYLPFSSMEMARDAILANDQFDLVVFESDFISELNQAGVLSELDHSLLSNISYLSPDFRDLDYDPGNHYSVPFQWGSTGLIIRSDLVEFIPQNWLDLWRDDLGCVIGVREGAPYDFIGIVLKSLGYSANSEDRDELLVAFERIMMLEDRIRLVDYSSERAVEPLLSGEINTLIGWSEDYWLAKENSEDIEFVIGIEGALLRVDNYVIPSSCEHRQEAHMLLNFLMRPDIAAEISNWNYYASANLAAEEFIEEKILQSHIVYPSPEDMRDAEVFLPRSDDSDQLVLLIWEEFLAETGVK
ncbi:MAG: spermidine/putrescine ABC transporter substrate-binding protein [Anaerolineales bacterium]|nr:spermidine/putrescine ABC transporter substrate-binding protein [Anaerolineales bacterium]